MGGIMNKELIEYHAKRISLTDGFKLASIHFYTDLNGEVLFSRLRFQNPQTLEKKSYPLLL
jgi:hypothetical protein